MTALRPVKQHYVDAVIEDVKSQMIADTGDLGRHDLAAVIVAIDIIMRTPSAFTQRALVDVLESQGVLLESARTHRTFMAKEGEFSASFSRRLSVDIEGF